MNQRAVDDTRMQWVELECLLKCWRRRGKIFFYSVPPAKHKPGDGIVGVEFEGAINELLSLQLEIPTFLLPNIVAGLCQQ